MVSSQDTEMMYNTFIDAVDIMVTSYNKAASGKNPETLQRDAQVVMETLETLVKDEGAQIKLAQHVWANAVEEDVGLKAKAANFLEEHGAPTTYGADLD